MVRLSWDSLGLRASNIAHRPARAWHHPPVATSRTASERRRGAFIALLALCIGLRASFAFAEQPIAGHDHAQLAQTHGEHANHWLDDHLDADHAESEVDGFHEHASHGICTAAALPSQATANTFARSPDSLLDPRAAPRCTDPPSDRFRPPIA